MWKNIKTFLRLLSQYPGRSTILVIALVFASITEFISLSLFIPIIEYIQQGQDLQPTNKMLAVILDWMGRYNIEPNLKNLLWIAFLGTSLQFTVTFIQNILTVNLFFPIRKNIRDQCFNNLMDTSISYFTHKKGGGLVNIMTERIDTVGYIINLSILLISDLCLMVTYLVFVCVVSWQISLMVLGVAIIKFGFTHSFVKRSKQLGEDWLKDGKAQSSRLVESLTAVRLIKSFSREDFEKERFSNHTTKYMNTQVRYAMNEEMMKLIDNILAPLLICVIIYISVAVLEISASYILIYLFALLKMTPRLTKMNTYRNQLSINMANMEAILDLLKIDNKPHVEVGEKSINYFKDVIKVDNVSFEYESNRPILKDVNFEVKKGESVAIVGSSGSGKSTFVNLFLHLYDPTKGSIMIDGQDLRDIDLTQWHNLIGFVDQDTFIFNDTVRNNIRYGRLGATFEDVVAAAKKAHIHDAIIDMEDGYDTILGERGVKVSGGQKQRLAIARAIIKEPQIIVFDEATSSLDSISEEMVRQSIDELSRECTTIIIAHRLSTVRNADKIIVLENGQLVESGKHQTLLAANGRYTNLYKMQNREIVHDSLIINDLPESVL